MKKELLGKAVELVEEIEKIENVLEDAKKHRWISVIGATNTELFYSERFQKELAEWLEQKREQYQKEFDAL